MHLDLQARINNYIESTKGMKVVSFDVVLDNMLAENKITRAEYDELMRTSVFGYQEFSSDADNVSGIWGLSLSDQAVKTGLSEKKKTEEVEFVSKEKVQELLLNADEKLADAKEFLEELGFEINDKFEFQSEEFTLDYVKSLFDEELYDIKEYGYTIEVYSLTNEGEKISFSKDGSGIDKYVNYDELAVGLFTFKSEYSGNYVITRINGDNVGYTYNAKGKLNKITIGDVQAYVQLDENQKVSYIDHRDQELSYTTIKREYAVVDEMIKLKDNSKKLFELLEKNLNYQNVGSILFEYKERTGVNLIVDFLVNKNDEYDKLAHLLISKFVNTERHFYADEYESEKKIEISAECIQTAIASRDDVAVHNSLALLNRDTVYGVINNYRKFKEDNSSHINPPMRSITSLIEDLQVLGYDDLVRYQIVQNLQNAFISEDDKELAEFMLKEIPVILQAQIEDGVYVDDIKADMARNNGIVKNLLIDLKRVVTRNKPRKDNNVIKPDGKFEDPVQQGRIGDCWLIAGLMSIYEKEAGREYLESLVQANVSGDIVTVKLPGVGKQYKITWEEILANGHLVKGDGDVRAIEIAIDKYIKEIAYEEKSFHNVDIDGNNLTFIYDVLIGKQEEKQDCVSEYYYSRSANSERDIEKSDLEKMNDPATFYSLAFDSRLNKPEKLEGAVTVDGSDKKVDLHTSHAYAVIKSDENYVYMINPWNSKEVLKVEKDKLLELYPSVGVRTLPDFVNKSMMFQPKSKRNFF